VTNHDRLVDIKNMLQDLNTTGELTTEQLSMIHAKDILAFRSKEPTEETLEEIR
jgi:hypothetical protein